MTADEKQAPRTRRARPARPARRRTAATPILAQLLTAAVEANPTGIAVEDGDRTLTYLELDAWSSRLARVLMARGIGPESFVPLAMYRSMDLIVATWAVIKTGAAYVPIDPAHPRTRIDTMLGRVRASLGLTVGAHRLALPDDLDWLVLDNEATMIAVESQLSDPIGYADRLGRVRPENTAYVIHTSGSTGMPKGIELTHAGVAVLTAQLPRLYHIEKSSRVLVLASPSFDVAVLELLMAISAGATMVISPPTIYGGPELAEIIRSRAVSHAFITPSVLTSIDPTGLDGLTDLLAGGEAISPEVVAIWAPGRRLYNVWGPAEATIENATSDVPMSPDRSVTLGRPLEGVAIRVLDERLRPVPAGVVGEAYLGGYCVGRGYRGQHALTAARFVADPDGPPGARLYRSGDLVRWTPDGELEIIGRSDFQVKIRGLRIELGEVESAMAAHPDVEHAVAVVRRDAPNQVDLVGYVVGIAGREVDGEAVRAAVAERLPGYMVPVDVVVLDAFPLNTNRKLDRDALPAPQRRRAESRPPQTPSEIAVADVFREVLDLPEVGADDDFFTMGGNSLSATQVITRINSRLGVSLALRALFDASTVAGLAARVDESSTGGRIELAPRPRPDRVPLSMAQQRLWFLNRLDATAAGYNIVVILRLTGALDVPALSAAVGDLFARHEVLRTVYPEIDGIGYQDVRPLEDVAFDLVAQPVDERDVQKLAIATFEAGFDVTSEIPIRLLLLQIGADDYVLVIGVHHIAADGLSMGPLTRDMVLAYEARRFGYAPSWQPLPVQYVDYTLWQREVLGDESSPDSLISRQIDYWRGQLDGLPEQIDLPTDRPRPRVLSSRGGAVPIDISADVHVGLAELARRANATMFMVVHTALAILLARLSAGNDIAVGSPIGGRGEEKLDGLIGMFVNTLVFRTRIDPADSFDDILAQVRETDLQAFAHADVPFERLVEVLNPARSRSRHPLFQVGLSFQNLGASAFDLSDLQVSRIEADADISQFDLHVIVSDQFGPDGEPAGLLGEMTYVSDLYDRATAEAFVERLVGLLGVIGSGSTGGPVGDLDLLNAGEYRELVGLRNATAVERPVETLADRFAAAAATHPDAIAIDAEDGTQTYAQFAARVHRLARRLIGLGVGPDTPVAIRMRRSSSMLVAIHAVIQAGGAYVPIDPDAPQGRVEYVLATANPAVILVDSSDDGAGIDIPAVVVTDDIAADLPSGPIRPDERLAPLRPGNTAYIIFTSGSTGRPKGVAVSHESIVNRLDWMQSEYVLTPADVVLHKTPTTFDVSVWELFWPLEIGAAMVIARPDGHRDPVYLAETMRSRRVTTVHFVPSMLAAFLDDESVAARADALTKVFCSGEALPAHVAGRVEQILPNARVHNLYGPTEAAVDVTYHEVNSADTTVVPIGRPVDNTSVYVLDSRLRLAPDGVVGELYLGGVQLARGYVSRPELTADRFVANHFGVPGSRLYRTGDLVRWEHGELVYIGRSDFQVKLRGLRIELGEVESVLAADDAVAEAVVLVRNDQLVAYLVLRDPSADPHAVVSATRRSLPDYMVPDRVIVLDALPTNANGKLDRGALPDPSLTAQSSREPSTAAEKAVAAVFAEVLQRDRVGADDDFFELGGNSLIATRMVSRLGAAFGVAVPVRLMFEAPTVSALAQILPSLTNAEHVALTAQERPDRIPLSAAQNRMWFLNRFDTAAGTNNIPVVLRLTGSVDVAALTAAFADVFDRHESLRTIYPEFDGEGSQLILPPDDPRIPGLQLVAVSEATVLERAVEMVWAGFDVTTEVPVRAGLLAVSPTEHALVVVLHHIAADGVSMGPLTRDVIVAYEARRTGTPLAWAPLPVQYADYTLWQRATLGDESNPESLAARQLAYWRGRLAGVPEEVTLPTDRPRPTVLSGRGGTVRFDVDERVVVGIRDLARRLGVTDFMIVHAALAVLVGRMANTSDVVIGTPVAGRGERELDDVVGMFVNTLVLRTQLDWSSSFADVVALARDVDLGAFGHADVPFERLVEVLDPPRSQSRHPLFQVAVFFENLDSARFELPGLEITVPQLDNPLAKFDLQVTVGDVPGADGEPGRITIELLYAEDLFESRSIENFGARLRGILAAVTADAGAVVGDLPVTLPGERDSALATWGGAPLVAGEAGAEGRDGVWAHARSRPNAPALVTDSGGVLTFRDLGDRVGRLARLLVDAGVGPEVSVVLGLRRGVDLVVAMYAVLEAGGVFVPVDPDHPAERVRYVLGVVGDSLVLSVSEIGFADRFGIAPHRVLDLDVVDPSGGRGGRLRPADRRGAITGTDGAYVLFTSGSTGRPKGVVVSRAAISNQVAWMAEEFDFGPREVYLQKTPVTFDVSLWGYLVPLSAGSSVVLASPEGHRDPGYIAGLVERFAVTLTDFVPSMLVVFAQTIGPAAADALATLRDVFVIGEALTTEAVRAFGEISAARIWNIYGPTEAAVSVSLARAIAPAEVPADARRGGSVSIGVGEPGVRLYVLDSRLRPVPDGVPGELYIGGVQVARGYLGRPGLSAERFIADPFALYPSALAVGGVAGERMYRTGDVVIRDGAGLNYVGRSDFQVKLRGQRIELGEIESVLVSLPGVAAAVVVVAGSGGGERLVGYVVGESGVAIDEAALRERLGGHLPGYMVPERIVVLEAFPLNPAGKVDRAALPDPGIAAHEFRVPVTVVQGVVAAVFGDVLDVGRVGLDDDFFELGGNSLTAMRVVARLGASLGITVPVRTLFQAPTVERIAAAIEGLSTASRPDLVAAVRPEYIPLSLAQARMWFLNRLEPASVANNIPIVLRLTGEIDLPALANAFDDVVGRHEVLRTVYPERDGTGTQIILPSDDPRIPRLQQREVASPDEVVPVVTEFLTRGFDVTTAIPVRAGIVRVAPQEHLLLVVMHHIAADGFSMLPLTRDVLVAYQARRTGGEPNWQPLEIQYANYTLWQRELLGDEADPTSIAHAQLAYWRDQLAGYPEEVTLPLDRPRPTKQSGAGASVRFAIDPATTAAIVAVGRRLGATPFMVVHAALAALLARSTDGGDVVIGTPIAGRGERALDDLVGMFVNTLVLRTDVRSSMTFAQLVDEVRRVDLDAFAHADLPFERLVEVLDPPRAGGRPPLFQVALSFQNFGPGTGAAMRFDGLTVEPIEDGAPPAKFDLQITLTEPADANAGYAVDVTYATDLFDRSTIDGFVGRFVRVLRAIAQTDADPVVGDIDLLDESEFAALTTVTGGGEWGFDTMIDVLEHAVAVDPDADALVLGSARLTYRELDERSSRLARELIARGVRAETLVAIALPRSFEQITAIFAVLKAGGAYVPIDVRYPLDRVRYILEASEAAIGLSTSSFVDAVVSGSDATDGVDWLLTDAADLDDLLAARSAAPVTDADRTALVHAGSPAYEIFTSGSTGLPKGVVVPHGGLVALLGEVADRTATSSPTRSLAVASPSFDASVLELLVMLASAGTMVIAPGEVFAGDDLVELIDRESITHAFVTPAVLASMNAEALSGRLEVLLSGGEAVPSTVVDAWAPGRRFFNAYGPTETTIVSAIAGPLIAGHPVPIGGPPRGTTLYVLDERLHPVPQGVAGELYVSGAGVTRGYQGRPDLTADRFVPDPFAGVDAPGRRMYRTGDVVRWVAPGVVEYLGRSDDQVKIRGLRIELGEIDAVLAATPRVSAAATLVHTDDAGRPHLVAWVVGDPTTLDPDAVIAAAAAALPGYMVPSVVTVIDALPVTGNGKLDRKALPAPVFAAREFRAPTTSVQQAVALVFAEVLAVDKVGVDDDFFALGGHSLLVTRVARRLRELTGAPVSLQQVFDHSTVAGLARSIEVSEVTEEASDFTHYVRLASDIVPAASGPGLEPPRVALLTGATGFLGSHLVRELIDASMTVIALVRADSESDGFERVAASMRRYGAWRDGDAERMRVIPSDLAIPGLGLTEDQFAELAREVDVIVHNGARVNHVENYRRLHEPNVRATEDLLRLAVTVRNKPFHYVSTGSVLTDITALTAAGRLVVGENDRAPAAGLLDNGYVQSKWVAEEIVEIARTRGVTATIHRPGQITGDLATGAAGTDDAFWNMVRAIAGLGIVPDLAEGSVAMVPVNFVARAMVALILEPAARGRDFNLVNTERVSMALLGERLTAAGFDLEPVTTERFATELFTVGEELAAQGDEGLVRAILVSGEFAGGMAETIVITNDATRAMLEPMGVVCPVVDRAVLDRYIDYFVGIGFLKRLR